MQTVQVQEFFEDEFPNFAIYNLYRMVGSYVDGLKPSQRKIIHTVGKYNITSPIKVSQLASKTSECIHEDTLINVEGELIPVKMLLDKNFFIESFNEEKQEWELDECLTVFISKTSTEFLEIEMVNGDVIKVTPDHKILTTRGWVRADHLKDDHEIISK